MSMVKFIERRECCPICGRPLNDRGKVQGAGTRCFKAVKAIKPHLLDDNGHVDASKVTEDDRHDVMVYLKISAKV